MSMPPALLDLQRGFATALDGDDDGGLHPWIADRGIAPQARLRIYRNARFATHVETLLSIFPAVTRWIGEACCDGLATRFATRHGSRSGNLQDFGRGFPAFLRAQPETTAWTWLAELAQLEWLRQECALAAEWPSPHADELIAAIASDMSHALRLQPHVRALSATVAVLDRWNAAMRADNASENASVPQSVLLWRMGDEVCMEIVDAACAVFVQRLIEDAPLADALAIACGDDVAPESLLRPLLERVLLAVVPEDSRNPSSCHPEAAP